MFGTRTAVAAAILSATLLASASPAQARITVGYGDQKPSMFADSRFKDLDVGHARLVVPWDAINNGGWEVAVVDAWMAGAQAAGVKPMVTFNHSRDRAKYLPTVAEYRQAFRAFRARYPHVREYTPWNEANHVSQPTYKNPRRAAQYFLAARAACSGCTVLAADLLDSSNVKRYVKRFKRAAKGKARVWGLHNYIDAQRRGKLRKSRTAKFARLVRGTVWITETGGLVRFKTVDGRLPYPYNERRAAGALRRALDLTRASSRIKRIYLYHWQQDGADQRWDSAVIRSDGTARRGYEVLRAWVRKHGK